MDVVTFLKNELEKRKGKKVANLFKKELYYTLSDDCVYLSNDKSKETLEYVGDFNKLNLTYTINNSEFLDDLYVIKVEDKGTKLKKIWFTLILEDKELRAYTYSMRAIESLEGWEFVHFDNLNLYSLYNYGGRALGIRKRYEDLKIKDIHIEDGYVKNYDWYLVNSSKVFVEEDVTLSDEQKERISKLLSKEKENLEREKRKLTLKENNNTYLLNNLNK